MKHFVTSLLTFLLFLGTLYAQNSVTLVVVGEGDSKDAATQSALRSAIEQSYGAFVSSNTSILNDELVKDEIVSVSSGNIQKFKELSSSILPNGRYSVSLETTVSLTRLTSFAQSKGSECELAGATFAANLQVAKFYQDAETKAIDHLLTELYHMLPSMYDYSISVSDPKPVQNRHETPTEYRVTFNVILTANEASNQFCTTLVNTLTGLSMDDKTASAYRQLTGVKVNPFDIDDEGKVIKWGAFKKIQLRLNENVEAIESFINNTLINSMISFVVEDNLGGTHNPKLGTHYVGSYSSGSEREVLDGDWPEMGWRNGDYAIRFFWKRKKYNGYFDIKIPMDEIGKYKKFTIRKITE